MQYEQEMKKLISISKKHHFFDYTQQLAEELAYYFMKEAMYKQAVTYFDMTVRYYKELK